MFFLVMDWGSCIIHYAGTHAGTQALTLKDRVSVLCRHAGTHVDGVAEGLVLHQGDVQRPAEAVGGAGVSGE